MWVRPTREKVQKKHNNKIGGKKKKAKEMKGSTFKANRRGEDGGEFSLEAPEAEWPGDKRHGSEVRDIFKKQGTADCFVHQ